MDTLVGVLLVVVFVAVMEQATRAATCKVRGRHDWQAYNDGWQCRTCRHRLQPME